MQKDTPGRLLIGELHRPPLLRVERMRETVRQVKNVSRRCHRVSPPSAELAPLVDVLAHMGRKILLASILLGGRGHRGSAKGRRPAADGIVTPPSGDTPEEVPTTTERPLPLQARSADRALS